jgi:hypothetical protein
LKQSLNGCGLLIRVLCAECGESFEIGEDFSGLTEFCPFCGAFCDIPAIEDERPQGGADESQLVAIAEAEPPNPLPTPIVPPGPARGIPSPIWWALIIGGLSFFVAACFFLFSDNWEMRNIQSLNDAANRGDVLMADEDFSGAAGQYRFVLDTVGSRDIQSTYIRHLMDRARRGESLAKSRASQAQAEQSETQNTSRSATSAPSGNAATVPPDDFHNALKAFQRDSEAFPLFVRNHIMDFQDGDGHWRRRQFTVWDVTYERQTDSKRPRIMLLYSLASRVTEPHENRHQADDDGNFVNDESPKTVHCQTLFELFAGQWIVLHHDVDAGGTTRPSAQDFYELERQAFHAAVIPQ